jgi:hypothetical protein
MGEKDVEHADVCRAGALVTGVFGSIAPYVVLDCIFVLSDHLPTVIRVGSEPL